VYEITAVQTCGLWANSFNYLEHYLKWPARPVMSPKLSWLLASSAIINVLPAGRMKENAVLISDVLI
jgi:hypothetical protein